MFRHKILLAISVISLVGACTNRPAYTAGFRANLSETLNVRLAPALVPQAIRALQSSTTLDDTKVALQIQPTYAMRRRSTAATSAYTAALDDAGAKAQAIAAHERVALGKVRSVTEMIPQAAGESGYENLGAAQHRLGSVEDSVRGIVARFGARPQDIVVTSADANTF